MDKEQKIAEIRKSAEEARKTDRSWVDGQDYADDVKFLLDELERLEREYAEERAAHNAHVTELIEKEAKLNQALEENERLKIRDELLEQLHAQIKYYFGGDGGLPKLQDGVNKLLQERQKLIESYAKIINDLEEDCERFYEQRNKMIEGLKYGHRFAKRDDLYDKDYVDGILKEIGVTME